MEHSQQLRIIAGGTALVVITGLAGAWLGHPSLFAEPRFFQLIVTASVVFAPVFLLLAGMLSLAGGASSVSNYIFFVVAVGAFGAFPLYPVLRLRRAGAVSVVGLVGWLACQWYVVSAWESL